MFEMIFRTTAGTCTSDKVLIDDLWTEIAAAYSGQSRHYHNLLHLDHLVNELSSIKENLVNWRAVIIAVAYHDIVYNVGKKDNEEQSARIALDRCAELHLPEKEKSFCGELILATKNHGKNIHDDINYFTDADLSILGAQPGIYETYTRQIRKEYALYPGFLYRPGRKKVLEHFSSMPFIFKTHFFNQKYEEQARENIHNELRKL